MQISAISFRQNLTPKKRVNYVKATGYGAIASGLACAFSAKKRKAHKFFAFGALVLSLAHIAILQSYKIAPKINNKNSK